MAAQLIDGKAQAAIMRAEISAQIAARLKQGFRQPALAVNRFGAWPKTV